MQDKKMEKAPVYRLQVDGEDVIIRFSPEKTENVRETVRDILTGSYEQRLQWALSGKDNAG